jgi:hypothetical protein
MPLFACPMRIRTSLGGREGSHSLGARMPNRPIFVPSLETNWPIESMPPTYSSYSYGEVHASKL